jgi:hypothetical protein
LRDQKGVHQSLRAWSLSSGVANVMV